MWPMETPASFGAEIWAKSGAARAKRRKRMGGSVSEAVAEGEEGLRVQAVLAQEIGGIAADERHTGGSAPMLSERLRELRAEPEAVTVLAHNTFQRDGAVGVEGIGCAADDGAGEAADGREAESAAMIGGRLAGVARDETPLAGLTLQLDHVEHVVVGLRVAGGEVRGFGFHGDGAEGDGGVGAVHAKLRVESLDGEVGLEAEEREMVEAVVEGEAVLGGRADVVPARAVLRCAGEIGRRFLQGNRRAPSLIEQRDTAGSEARLEHKIDRIGRCAVSEARGGDGEELVVDHVEEVARSEAVGRSEDVGLAPADELLAGFHGELAACVGGAQLADGEQRALPGAVEPGEIEVAGGLAVGVEAGVETGGETQVGEFVEGLVAKQGLADDVAGIVGRGIGVKLRRRFQEAALRQLGLCEGGKREQQEELHRRRACTVNSSSFIGRLYSSFCMRRMVRLFRRRSVISSARAVQMFCTFWMSVACRRRTSWSFTKFSY